MIKFSRNTIKHEWTDYAGWHGGYLCSCGEPWLIKGDRCLSQPTRKGFFFLNYFPPESVLVKTIKKDKHGRYVWHETLYVVEWNKSRVLAKIEKWTPKKV